MVDTRMPVPSAPTRKMPNTTSSDIQLPRMGRSNNAIADTITSTADTWDNTRYGSVLPTINAGVEIGAIRICSIVPCSFSRTIDRAVDTTAVIIEM